MRRTPPERPLFGIYFRTGPTQIWFMSKQPGGFDHRLRMLFRTRRPPKAGARPLARGGDNASYLLLASEVQGRSVVPDEIHIHRSGSAAADENELRGVPGAIGDLRKHDRR